MPFQESSTASRPISTGQPGWMHDTCSFAQMRLIAVKSAVAKAR